MDSRVGLAHLCRHTLCTRFGSSYIYPSIHPLAWKEDYDLRLDLAQIIQRSLVKDHRCCIALVRMEDAIRGLTVCFEKSDNLEKLPCEM